MIEKSRLEELIKEGATIYEAKYGKVNPVDLAKQRVRFISEKMNMIDFEPSTEEKYLNHKYFHRLFETKEEAEWYKEFGSIERTETLKLPTWEEFNKDNFGIKFYNKDREFRLHRVRYSSSDKNPLWRIDLYASYGDEDTIAWKKSWDLTKENYIESCKLCVKLFKGEE